MRRKSTLSILFENPFLVGIFEREDDGKYEVCKITFGAEPTDGQVYEFMLRNWDKLRFSSAISVEKQEKKAIDPKRLQREIHKNCQTLSIGTKAQQALKKQQEEHKTLKRITTKEEKEAQKQEQFSMRIQKKKEKHKGH